MLRFKFLAAALLAATAVPASASVISMHTRHSTAGVQASGAAYKALVEAALAVAPTPGYCDATNLASFSGLGSQAACGVAGANLAKAFFIDFGLTAAQALDFDVRIAPDFGNGGAVFLDGVLLGVSFDNLWWGNSWANSGEIFQFDDIALGAGLHQLAIYGLEDCCDASTGGQQADFRIGNGAWTVFAANDGLVGPTSVPEPASLGLALVALAGAAGLRRRAARDAS